MAADQAASRFAACNTPGQLIIQLAQAITR